ncbi:MAG: hypothetical protein FJ053_00220 [Cyanobacteria bacterium M_surface_10_m1_298]|nr:hypothetical protein [Cyanobacteria bacterium M_surface_10_m1_298]
MSFDARSLERLQQLGRTLPKPLPKPETQTDPEGHRGGAKRHRVETETDPQALFGELIKASEDGTIPPHLLDRLRQAERDQERKRQSAQRQDLETLQTQVNAGAGSSPARARQEVLRPNQQRRKPSNDEEQELYVAFQQLLLEGDDD